LTNVVPVKDDQRFSEAMDRYLALANHRLSESMRSMEQLVTVEPATTVGNCLALAAESGYSRLPIADPDTGGLPAYVLVRDLLFLPRAEHEVPVPRRLWRSLLLVDERMTPYELFEELRSQGRQLAVVADTAGNPLGMITLEDLIETVIGSIQDEFDDEPAA
jgi:putative hemolysin